MDINIFKQDVELDAKIVLAGMKGGMDGIMSWGLLNRHIFETTQMLTDRCEWLKKQDTQYITKVSEKATELESK